MSRRAKDHIPHEILEAAHAAGEKAPLWYAGRSNGHERKGTGPTAHEVILEGRREAGVADVPDVDPLPPAKPDPYAD